MSRENLGSNLVFFLVGAAAGAAIALLYAPQDGETTRTMIGEKATAVKEKATDIAGTVATTAKDKWGTATEKIQGLVARSQNSANDAVDNVAERAHAAINSVS